MSATTTTRLVEHVQRLGEEHPPLRLEDVDFTVRDPRTFEQRFGHVLDYMARVELEVDRNVLELLTLLPDPPEVDRHFYADVWQPQEIQHGRILDELQVRLGRDRVLYCRVNNTLLITFLAIAGLILDPCTRWVPTPLSLCPGSSPLRAGWHSWWD